MAGINQYGLPRTIPEPIKREIRQNSGFGCVICGLGIYHYEHVDPEWHEATKHNPDKMTLLCPRHHHLVTGGMGTKDRVKKAMLTPFCKQIGFSREEFEIGDKIPIIRFAGALLERCRVPIAIFGEPLFEIKGPEKVGAPFRISGSFYNSQGDLSLRIIDNEWQAMTGNWDVEVVGTTITIREGSGNIHLQLTAKPPSGISVDKLNMVYKNVSFIGDVYKIQTGYLGKKPFFNFNQINSSGFEAGIEIIHAGEKSKFAASIGLEM